ncbi:MAG: tetratricopeptide repeat protein [Thermoanaerobaculia bacterium]|nr:tetratricopeptide repeat protein [Thermoanaerobaculia bacterium]
MRSTPLCPRPGLALLTAALAVAVGCSAYEPFETLPDLERQIEARLGSERGGRVEIPFALSEQILTEAKPFLAPSGSERDRVEEVIDFIFSGLDLKYSLTPTRNAAETFAVREGNCLSFVNLFVGLARQKRLNPFYVEVQDYQRWNFKDGVVISRGHIVAGINIDGNLRTYDFLPYRPKSYRDFEPVDDITAIAHFYNNLGAEALIEGDEERAESHLEIAVGLAPDFEKAINNLGVLMLRQGRAEDAKAVIDRGLGLHPTSVPLMSNLARVEQTLGNMERAEELLSQLEEVNETNPFFFVYRGEIALSGGDTRAALEYMRRALRTDSEVPEVHVGLAKVYIALGEIPKAKHHLERALRLDATHDEARKYAAMLQGGRPRSGSG